MGFGFSLFCIFILLPLTVLLFVGWVLTRRKVFGWLLGSLWAAVIGLVSAITIANIVLAPKDLSKQDYYGWYVIDRSYFPGRQADWQYNSLRFRITSRDSIYFYLTDEEKIQRVYRGRISTTTAYASQRLKLDMEQPTYHVLAGNPTTYRSVRGFHLVFHSAKFNDVYFKKGEWQPLPQAGPPQ